MATARKSSGKPVVVTENDEGGVSKRDQEFVKILKETLSAPAPGKGRTSRRVFVAFQVYHEEDFPIVTQPSEKKK